MALKRGLGRGLGALLPDGPGPAAAAGGRSNEIPVSAIKPNPRQPRTSFSVSALADLTASVAEFGVLVPILVRRVGAGYELIAGERRWRAAMAAKLATIPAVIRNSSDTESLEVAIIENLQRENLNALEEAAGFAQLLEEHEYTHERLAERLGRSRPVITNALRLLALPDAIKAHVRNGLLSAGHARALVGLAPAVARSLADRAVAGGLSVRALERLTAQQAKQVTQGRRERAGSPDDRAFEERLRRRFGTHVALQRGRHGGKIELRYTDETDLQRIADLLLGEDA